MPNNGGIETKRLVKEIRVWRILGTQNQFALFAVNP